MKAKIMAVLIALILIAVGGITYLDVSHMVKTNSAMAIRHHAPLPVQVADVRQRTITDVIGASGQTLQYDQATLTARISQPVKAVYFRIGDQVRKGQLLVEFDDGLIKADVQEAASLVEQAKTALRYSKLDYQRTLALYNQKLIAKVDLEQADMELKKRQWQYACAMQLLEKARQDLAYTAVRSTVNGVVMARSVNPGETPRIDEPLVTLGLVDTVYMVAQASEDRLGDIHVGQETQVLFDSFPNRTFTGRIERIDPTVDTKTRTFSVYIRIDNARGVLTPGMTGFARISNTKTALCVPSVSVLNPAGPASTVFVIGPGNRARICRVKAGISGNGFTQIKEGLKAGEKVAAGGIQYMLDGHRVNELSSQKDF